MSPRNKHRRPAERGWLRPGIILVVVVLIALGIATAATKLLANANPSASPSTSPSTSADATPSFGSGKPGCVDLVLPAYFSDWSAVFADKPVPADLILNPSTGIDAGTAPDPGFQTQVRQAQAAGITVLGYTSTNNAKYSMAQLEASVRHYKQWYGVTHIYLDVVLGDAAHLAYYQQIASYIHQLDGPGSVWLNPGYFPDEAYMSVGDVVDVFEGSYSQYLTAQVPSWARNYPAAKFANTIYATTAAVLPNTLKLAASRHAMHVFVTDEVLPDPYSGLPAYWSSEVADSCRA
jgi:hypothetical protein